MHGRLRPRELEILPLLVLQDAEIAELLGISYWTAKSHVQNILVAMGVQSRTRAIAMAIAWGIISLDDIPTLGQGVTR